MVRDPFADEGEPDLQSVLDALDDPSCRTIVQEMEGAMTANEVSDATDIPLSTTYRKLDLLTEASILNERTEIRSDGHHTTKYVLAFDAVEIGLNEDRDFEVSISRPAGSADEQLARLWNEVRKET
ncbi:helix-turn-helix domain-containing protein [Halorubellus sp. JP-L1]|uniref:transcriptional regulator n=1 Tax=Halorubellus sp. JP-L1 TaxID=2715753 RepID=UPI00140D6FFD|nr:transcriptional regulator [Halorubellus sp. JP-L1]NHN43292.1 helix-turn-helix domain-containing protein [Halorubellus sp. JP-L1]